jgi:hypothetical protein
MGRWWAEGPGRWTHGGQRAQVDGPMAGRGPRQMDPWPVEGPGRWADGGQRAQVDWPMAGSGPRSMGRWRAEGPGRWADGGQRAQADGPMAGRGPRQMDPWRAEGPGRWADGGQRAQADGPMAGRGPRSMGRWRAEGGPAPIILPLGAAGTSAGRKLCRRAAHLRGDFCYAGSACGPSLPRRPSLPALSRRPLKIRPIGPRPATCVPLGPPFRPTRAGGLIGRGAAWLGTTASGPRAGGSQA